MLVHLSLDYPNKNVNLKPELITQLNKLESQNLDIYYDVLNNLNNTNTLRKRKKHY